MRLEVRCCTLALLLAAQLVFMLYYVFVTAPLTQHTASPRTWSAIRFVQDFAQHQDAKPRSSKKHHFLQPPVQLAKLQLDRRKHFGLFNTTPCFLRGTDIRFSQRFSTCQCLPGWHGTDCGLPEVMWRAARHKEMPQRRTKPRRLVCYITVQTPSPLVEVLILELSAVVDLFIVAQANITQPLELPTNVQMKTLKFNIISGDTIPWHETRQLLPDLKYDDLIIFVTDEQIPNSKALLFFKLYDGWQEPITFRLKWSVYGFFWQHPTRTIVGGAACTAGLLAKHFSDNVSKLIGQNQFLLIVGDLNHFGGWQCKWCLETPHEIIMRLQAVQPKEWDVSDKKIDEAYLEELIGNGLWVDGKTQLLRCSPSRDSYFAPSAVFNHSWKYDFLTRNIHARLDY